MTHRLFALVALTSLLAGIFTGSPSPVSAAETVLLPFPAGYAAKVIQGYNGGTHRGVEQYSLDLALVNGSTGGAPVVSPVNGRIDWAGGPGAGNGSFGILLADGSGLGVMLSHVVLDRAYRSGETVRQGQRLGFAGYPGTVGNNGTAHIHVQLYAGGGGRRTPLPFASPAGRPLDGRNLPNTGRYNDHAGQTLVSSNGGGSAPASDARTTTGTSSRGAAQSAAATPTPTPVPRIRAEVRGNGDCLNIRSEPTVLAEVVECLPDGTSVAIVAGPVHAEGLSWYRLADQGWAIDYYLKPVV